MFNTKKKYFRKMLQDADRVIWDLEFKKFTALNEREVTRRQYDQAQDALARITQSLKGKKDEKVEAEKASVEKYISDTKKHLDAVDATIAGGAPSELLPDGAEGLDNKLKQWADRREYIKRFIQTNC